MSDSDLMMLVSAVDWTGWIVALLAVLLVGSKTTIRWKGKEVFYAGWRAAPTIAAPRSVGMTRHELGAEIAKAMAEARGELGEHKERNTKEEAAQ